MTSGQDGEPDEVNNLQYPSPGAEALDAGPFYHTVPRDDVPDQQDQSDHHVSDQVHDPDQGVDGLSHDPSSPPHHISRPANLEELQLAAQLGQGLAGTSIMPATDPNMNVEDPSMRNIMPHPEQDHQEPPSYVQDTPPTDHMVSHAIPVPVGPPLPPPYPMGDGIPPRKRSKVSRACDECRRKKIKCDAQSDTGDAPCSSCARSSIRCLFSRVPQKRGPSKGYVVVQVSHVFVMRVDFTNTMLISYIKELADRIHSIENKLESEGSLTQDDIDRLFAPDRPRAYNNLVSTAEDSNRKRPFSSISSGDFGTPAPARQAPWGSEPRPIQPATTPSETYAAPTYANSALAPQPLAVKPDDSPSKDVTVTEDDPMSDVEDVPEIDDGAFLE